MMTRLRLYQQNVGTASLLINLAVIGLISYRIFQIGDPLLRIVMGVIMAVAAVTSWLVLPLDNRFPRAGNALCRAAWWITIALFAINITSVIHLPPLVWLAGLFILIWGVGANFWLLSEPGNMTERAVKQMMARHAAQRAGASPGD